MDMKAQRNVFGVLLVISGANMLIASQVIGFYAHITVIVLLLILGAVFAIAALTFMDALVKGGALLFLGVVLVLSDLILQHLMGPFSPRLLMWIGIPALIFGIILSSTCLRER